jgi:hypothetical protein
VLFPFKGKYSPPADEPEAKRPRTDGQTTSSEITSNGKISFSARVKGLYLIYPNHRLLGKEKILPYSSWFYEAIPLANRSVWFVDVSF